MGRDCCPILDNFTNNYRGLERRENEETARIELDYTGFILNANRERLGEESDAFRIKPVGLKRWVKL